MKEEKIRINSKVIILYFQIYNFLVTIIGIAMTVSIL